MRAVALFIAGLAVGCSSTLQRSDGGGSGGGTGAAGAGGSDAGTCIVDGASVPNGTEFPCGCTSCVCLGGAIGFHPVECVDAAHCRIDTPYTYGDTGGLVAYEDATTLTPPWSWTRTRTSHVMSTASGSCEVRLLCLIDGDGSMVDVERIKVDIADGAVQAAFAMATPPTYGRDTRPVDGTVFQFLRDDGRGFVVGSPCTGSAGCTDAPAGIATLVADLRTLDERQLMDPSCAALR